MWPNPVQTGNFVNLIVNPTVAGTMHLKCFTMSTRLVTDLSWSLQAQEKTLQWSLVDRRGKPLADGLYYVVLEGPDGRRVLKLLVLR
jgi:hypothetical protein